MYLICHVLRDQGKVLSSDYFSQPEDLLIAICAIPLTPPEKPTKNETVSDCCICMCEIETDEPTYHLSCKHVIHRCQVYFIIVSCKFLLNTDEQYC